MVFKASLKRCLSAKAGWTSGVSRRLGFGSKARGFFHHRSSPGESQGDARAKEAATVGGSKGGGRDGR
jgi:hypothetical protein